LGRRKFRGVVRRVLRSHRVVEAGIRHLSTGGPAVTVQERRGCRTCQPPSPTSRLTSRSEVHHALALFTMENINGVSNEFQWSPGIVASCASIHSSHPLSFSSSGQNSTQSWSTSLPQTSSSPSLPNTPSPLRLNHVNLSEEWPRLREMIKYKIQRVRYAASPSRLQLTDVRLQEH